MLWSRSACVGGFHLVRALCFCDKAIVRGFFLLQSGLSFDTRRLVCFLLQNDCLGGCFVTKWLILDLEVFLLQGGLSWYNAIVIFGGVREWQEPPPSSHVVITQRVIYKCILYNNTHYTMHITHDIQYTMFII